MIRFKSYKNNNVLVDFKELVISNSNLASFIKDLASPSQGVTIELLTDSTEGKAIEYKIVNDGTVKIYKDNAISTYTGFYELLNSEFFINVTPELISSRIIQLDNPEAFDSAISSIPAIQVDVDIKTKLDSAKIALDELLKKIESGFNTDQKDKYSRLNELNSRLASIQDQIDSFQGEKKTKEEINSKIKKFNQEKTAINQMLESVELLIKTRDDLKQKVLSFNQQNQAATNVSELKQKKLQYQNSILYTKKAQVESQVDDVQENKKPFLNFSLSPIPILGFLNIAISIIAFLYSYNFNILVVAVVSTILIMITYIIARFFKDSLEDIEVEQVTKTNESRSEVKAMSTQDDPNSQIFINAAWANALNSELNTIEQNIEKNLNGKSYEAIKLELQQINNSLELENKKMEELSAKSITSDEYYKKRREADILKIERENLEFGLKIEPALMEEKTDLEKSIKDLSQKQVVAEANAMQFPIFVSSNLEKDRFFAIKHNLLCQIVLVTAN